MSSPHKQRRFQELLKEALVIHLPEPEIDPQAFAEFKASLHKKTAFRELSEPLIDRYARLCFGQKGGKTLVFFGGKHADMRAKMDEFVKFYNEEYATPQLMQATAAFANDADIAVETTGGDVSYKIKCKHHSPCFIGGCGAFSTYTGVSGEAFTEALKQVGEAEWSIPLSPPVDDVPFGRSHIIINNNPLLPGEADRFFEQHCSTVKQAHSLPTTTPDIDLTARGPRVQELVDVFMATTRRLS